MSWICDYFFFVCVTFLLWSPCLYAFLFVFFFSLFFFFFFQAEDGIRDWSVTGVQTCALPIYDHVELRIPRPGGRRDRDRGSREPGRAQSHAARPGQHARGATGPGAGAHRDRKSVV